MYLLLSWTNSFSVLGMLIYSLWNTRIYMNIYYKQGLKRLDTKHKMRQLETRMRQGRLLGTQYITFSLRFHVIKVAYESTWGYEVTSVRSYVTINSLRSCDGWLRLRKIGTMNWRCFVPYRFWKYGVSPTMYRLKTLYYFYYGDWDVDLGSRAFVGICAD